MRSGCSRIGRCDPLPRALGTSGFETAIRHAALRLPAKPRLAAWLAVVELGDGRLQFRSAELAFTLRHPFFVDVFRTVEPLLDGGHTADEIAEAGGAGVEPTTVLFLLNTLAANGLLQEGESPPSFSSAEFERWERQLRLFGHFVSDPVAIQAALMGARVALVGRGLLTEDVRRAVESLGVGDVVDVVPAGSRPDADGDGATAFLPADPVDLLVACSDSPGFGLFDAVNAACLETGARWMRVAMCGTTGLLGPTIMPGQTACYTCYDRRVRSHLTEPDGFLAYREQAARSEASADEGTLAPFSATVAGQAALEVARLLTGFAPPTTIGRFYELRVATPEVTGHDILRVPRCPSCRPEAPPSEPWDRALAPSRR